VAVQEREKQRPDVGAVDVGVRHDDNLVVPDIVDVELLTDSRADRGDQRADLVVFENPVEPVFLDVEDLPF